MVEHPQPSAAAMDEPAADAMQIEDVRRLAIVGAGTMGQQIGFQCAGHGYDVVVYDIDPAALEAAKKGIEAYAEGLEARGAIAPELRVCAQARIALTTDLPTAAQDADLLSEAVPEDPALKGRVLAEFNAVCPPRTIFMTNTSTLLPSQFAKASGRGDRLLALHFHLPVWINNLVDVMPHPGTAPPVTQLVLSTRRGRSSTTGRASWRRATARQCGVPQAVHRSRASRRQDGPGLLHLSRSGIRAAWLHRVAGLVILKARTARGPRLRAAAFVISLGGRDWLRTRRRST